MERYQDELEIRASDTPMDSSSGSFKVEEELFEHQRLYPSGWETRLLPDDRPSFSRVDGQASSFTEVSPLLLVARTEVQWLISV